MTDMKFQAGLSFASVYMKKLYRDGREILVCNSLVKFCLFILKANMAEKRSMDKQLLLTGTKIQNYLQIPPQQVLLTNWLCY